MSFLKSFKAYLLLERSMSENTISAYEHDAAMLLVFLETEYPGIQLEAVELKHLQKFLAHINDMELASFSQARIVSGVKAFFRFLLLEEIINADPSELLRAPKLKRILPEALTIEEVTELIDSIPLDKPEGHRNRAMLETLYSCGLRVSELTNMQLSNLYLDLGYIRIVGKGNKERLVPIGEEAAKQIKIYRETIRPHIPVKEASKDFLFLNRRGSKLSRIMIFHIIKEAMMKTGIAKNVYPHIFRHSFATHLVTAGADLRAVQQMLGHKSITTTEIYLHMDTGYLRDTLSKFHPRF